MGAATGGDSGVPSFIYLEGFSLGGDRQPETSQAMPAAEVLDRHVELHDRLAHPKHSLLRALVEWWAEHADGAEWADPETTFYPYHVLGRPEQPGWSERFCVDLARSLFTARTYQVTSAMCEVAEAMYEQTAKNAGCLLESDLPAETGFLWLDKPYRRDEGDDHIARFRALSWGVMTVRCGGEAKRAVRLAWWADWLNDAVAPELVKVESAAGVLGELGMVLASTMTVPFGSPFADPGRWSSPLHYAHTLWLLLGTETITDSSVPVISRHARRRALRSIQQNEVSVITLRRSRTDGEPGHREVDWSCRWLVRGFWRHLDHYPGASHEGRAGDNGLCVVCGCRVTWVRPYVKGPEGRPLKASRQIYRLSR